MVHQTFQGESAPTLGRSDGVYHIATVWFLSSAVVKATNTINIYLRIWRHFMCWALRFQKLILFWIWRHHGIALWHHGDGAWHHALLLMTVSNVNCSADVTKVLLHEKHDRVMSHHKKGHIFATHNIWVRVGFASRRNVSADNQEHTCRPHVGHVNLATWDIFQYHASISPAWHYFVCWLRTISQYVFTRPMLVECIWQLQ